MQVDMAKTIAHEAAIPNPLLKPLGLLVGEWRTEGSHPTSRDRAPWTRQFRVGR
jgi:hypothetical protein